MISGGNINIAAHLIREEPGGTLETTRKAWIVNSHIDLTTWNELYYISEDELDHAVTGVQG
jgi:hypothetical protein